MTYYNYSKKYQKKGIVIKMRGISEICCHERKKSNHDNLNYCTYNSRNRKELIYILHSKQSIDDLNPNRKIKVCIF